MARARAAASPPFVSVVIPTYNRAPLLARLLDALQRSVQPPGGMEVIVVDDGSTDDTRRVVEECGWPVRYLSQPNAGPAVARERGWRGASGDAIVFFDDDVIPQPGTILRLVDGLDDADGVGARVEPLDRKALIAHYMHLDDLVNHHQVGGDLRWLITAAVAYRRTALESVGGFDVTFRPAGEDVDLSLRMMEKGCRLHLDPDAIVLHDHRSTLPALFRDCYRYGRGYRLLAARHKSHRVERKRSAVLRLNPREWLRLYKKYRGAGASGGAAAIFLMLHAMVVFPYLLGVVRGRRNTLAVPHVASIELLGSAQPVPGAAGVSLMAEATEQGAPAA